MLFLSKLTVVCWLLAFHAAEANIRLTINQQPINALITKNFTLTCEYEDKNNLVRYIRLAKIITIGGGEKIDKLVAMDRGSKIHNFTPSPNVKYTGGKHGKEVYLSGTWKKTPKGFGGLYVCLVDKSNGEGIMQIIRRTIQIKEEADPMVVVAVAIKELQTSVAHSAATINELQTSEAHREAAIKELQTSVHKMQAWKEDVILANNLLDQSAMDMLYSIKYKNQYYFFSKHGVRHVRDAEAFCLTRGGYLAELNDFNEWKFVRSFITSVPSKFSYCYVSGRRNLANNKFYWPRIGKGRPIYVNWGRGQPNNYQGLQNCLAMDRAFNWRISDLTCSYTNRFVCEKSAI